MGLKGNWVDKVDGESYVLSDDINQIAHAVIEQEEEKEKTDEKINGLSDKVDGIVRVPSAVEVENGKVLKSLDGRWVAADDEVGSDASEYSIPTFDLAALGLPTVPMDGSHAFVETDTTDIMAALDKGAIKIIAAFGMGASTVTAEVVMGGIHVGAMGVYICSYPFDYEGMKLMFNLVVGDGAIGAYYTDLSGCGASGLPEVTTEDEGKFLRVVNGAWSAVSLTDVSTEGA